MKKSFFFVLGLVVALVSSFFVSCSDDNDGNNGVVSCTVSATVTEGGSVTIENYSGNTAVLLAGNTVKLIATPNEGYQFIGWYIGGSKTPVSTELTYSFVANKDIAYVAKFEKLYAISVHSTANGSVAFKDAQDNLLELLIGSEVTVIATPDESTDFIGWYIGDSNEPVSTEAIYTFTVAENVTLVAKFNKWPLVSIRSGSNGTVSFENYSELSQYIQIGDEVTIVATPNEKCEFIGWFIGDSETAVSTEATYTFTVAENVTLVAKFNKWPLVSISSGGNGTVSFENSSELSQYIQIGEDVTVVATPANNDYAKYEFIGWFIGNSNKPVSTDATYTFIVEEFVTLVAKFKVLFEAVDLGLSVKWANYNVGANYPEDYGYYYAWGEVEEKESYNKEDYVEPPFYSTDSWSGELPADYDVAHVKWGGDWRMPTIEEQYELRNECTWQWTSLNGVRGYRVTGPNGNNIFLPAAGYREGTAFINQNLYGSYWGSSWNSSALVYLCYLNFKASELSISDNWIDNCGYYGRSVRPVCK